MDQIKITELPDFAQLAFEGYKTLNRIQSRLFPTAFNSNENLLVSMLDLTNDVAVETFFDA